VRVLQSKRTRQEDRIPLEELQAFSEAIMKMAKISEFNMILFSKIIEEIRECVASRLWHLVVHISDLMLHLRSIKDYFLLSKGEFYQTFLSDARHIMTLPPRTSAQDDLNLGPLQTTVSKLRLEDDPIMKNYKLKLRSFSF
jgi:gamma-tubulin complex component 4